MSSRRTLKLYLSMTPLLAICVGFIVPAFAEDEDWTASPTGSVERGAVRVVERLQNDYEQTEPFFRDAYGYAVFPTITRVGIGFGGAYGKGIVVVNDEVIGRASYKQFSSGIQAGAKGFGMIIFFRDDAALKEFQAQKTQFTGQAGIAVLNVSYDGTPAYNEGVAIFVVPKIGLMGEFTYSGAWFRYWPLDTDE